MTLTTRMTLTLALTLSLATASFAQEATETTTATSTTTTTTEAKATKAAATDTTTADPEGTDQPSEEAAAPNDAPGSPYDVRSQFTARLNQHPNDLINILLLDPQLLANEQYMSSYPELAKFIQAHPEVAKSPRFYLADFRRIPERDSPVNEFLQGVIILASFGLGAFALAWLVRTIIEQKRWNRLSRTQTEVHNKILDRFGTTGELLEYVKSPAGTKFLESAPIPLHAEPSTPKSPMTRIMWSIQVGVVVIAAGIGMLLVSTKSSDQGFFALGVIGLCLGLGFLGSAYVSVAVSRRLGIWPENPPREMDDSGLVR